MHHKFVDIFKSLPAARVRVRIPPDLTAVYPPFQEFRIFLEILYRFLSRQRTSQASESPFRVELSLLIIIERVALYSPFLDKFREAIDGGLVGEKIDCKKYLEDYFNVKL